MKIILSRKGFDSSNGGIVSPIMEDGTLLSFPIPSDDSDMFENLVYNNHCYSKILSDLNYKGTNNHCHLDPDLSQDRRKNKIEGWQPIFGQVNSAAGYLLDTVEVKVGDVFLFFGNFHKVSLIDEKYQYVKNSGDFYSDKDLQVIWGYMQVGKIVRDSDTQLKYAWHPHSNKSRFINKHNNVMFLASDRLSFNESMPGSGLLKYRQDRVLTALNSNKATWIKRSVYDVDNVIGKRKNSSKCPDGIYYAGIWQELGLKETPDSVEWAESIIK